MEILGWIVAVLLMLAGLAGTILPGLPGTVLVFAGLFVGAWVDGFQHVDTPILVVLGGLSLLAYVIEIAAAGLGAKRANASRLAIVGATVGAVVGLFSGFVGLLFFPFIGAVAGEWIARRDLSQAGRAGVMTWIGMILGTAAQLALAFLMIGLFILAFFWPRS